MKKIYFAGKFNLIKKNIPLSDRLISDYRSKLLGDSKKLTYHSNNLALKDYNIIYNGCFYCEQASNGDYTSTDCETVVTEEIKQVLSSDIVCCIFDSNFSVGTVVELIEAAKAKKRIAIFYKNESSSYDIKSEYWFAITRACQIAKENNSVIEIFSYDNSVENILNNWLERIEKEI
ncbi:MAG: hypothetical protein II984_06765 [Clostridia bacterium]|nr:hypothetical protein [Clostridia bacterium]